MSVISEQPTKFYPFEKKILFKGISDYFIMEEGMIALLTIPHSNDTDEDVYPRLLILLIQSQQSNLDRSVWSKTQNNGCFIYEIPSSLHIIDLTKTEFLTSGNTLIWIYGREIIYWEIFPQKDDESKYPSLLVNYRHWRCTHKLKNLSPIERQDFINVIFETRNGDINLSTSNSSDVWSDTNKESFTLTEKLFRKYLVNYYEPLYDLYKHEEVEQHDINISINEGDSEVEVSIENKSCNEYEYSQYEVLPNVLDKLYKLRVDYAIRSLFIYSKAIIKGERALNLLESILNFKTEYLITRQKDKTDSWFKLSVFGLSIIKQAFAKIYERSKKNSNILKGMKIIKRLTFYREKQNIIKFWFKWKLFHTNYLEQSNTISEMESVVINESKRRIISSSRWASKDLDQYSKNNIRERDIMMPPKYENRKTGTRRRIKRMTKWMSQINKNMIMK